MNTYFESFAFGDNSEMADELLGLVLSGKKTATVSVVIEGEAIPAVGDISLVLDGKGTPACEIRTTSVKVLPFKELTWELVRLEGEDDSFESWQAGNIGYWTRNGDREGYKFSEETLMAFEEFIIEKIF